MLCNKSIQNTIYKYVSIVNNNTQAADQLVNKVVWFFFMVIADRQELSKCK